MTFQEAETFIRLKVPPPFNEARYQLEPAFASLLRRFLQRLNEIPSLLPDDLVMFIEIYGLSNPIEWIWSDTIRSQRIKAMTQGATEAEAIARFPDPQPDNHFQLPLPRV